MKNLQNHIFSTTTCISKETMLKFINKQLSQKELHEVQKHLIDCDFCSEALEGLKYAKNSSVLFNIDHKITARTEQKTVPFARIILVAASVLFIAVGGYYTITNFNDVAQLKENELSYQEPKKNTTPTTIETLLPAQEEQLQEQKEAEGDKITVVEEDRYEVKAEEKASDYYRFADEKNKDSDVSKKEAQGYVSQQATSPNTITTSTGSTYKTELAESDDALMDIESTVTQDKTVLKESRIDSDSYRGGTKSDANFDQLAKNQAPNKVVSADKEKEKKSIDTKQRAKKAMEAPSSVSVSDELKNSTDKDTEEKLEQETISRNDNISTNETVSFSEASGGLATGSTTNSRSILTDGIADFNAKKYTEAIQNFDLILAESPTTTKTYEAKWYKALCLIELKDITAAKKLLNELVQVNNPFSKKAEDKLKELE